MNEPLDVLAVHALNAPDRLAVLVDENGGGTPSSTTFGQLNDQVNRLAHGLLAAGARPDESYPLDGMNLMASLTADSTPVARKLFWRYKNDLQQAHRDGDFKYLKIRNNTFLFNVVDDPMEPSAELELAGELV